MQQWLRIRQRVINEDVPKRQILRETGMHWRTLEKILRHNAPPGYRRDAPYPKPKIGPFLVRIRDILESDKELPKKQRHTAKRIFERIKDEGYEGGYTQVKEAVRELRRTTQEVFMPLIHRPGEAQVDFGHALVRLDGVLRKVVFFVMALPHSDAFFVQGFERECTETFWEGHVRAFEFFGGVPWRILYDNSKIAVSKIVGARERRITDGFARLVSHYLFDYHFCRVRRANEKGVVEGAVKFARLNFFVPVPQMRDLAALNGYLLARCRDDRKRRVRGKTAPKERVLLEDRAAFRPLPPTPFDACRPQAGQADAESLVRFDKNDYSVPVEYAHHPVLVKGYAEKVRICCGKQVVAEHRRCWDTEQQCLEPLHYLPLAERKPGSLDDARPLEDWVLPESFAILRRRLEEDHPENPGEGTREYVRVLRLLEKYTLEELGQAVDKGLRARTHTAEAVAQFLAASPSWEATTFKLDGRPHLRHVTVAPCDLTAYGRLQRVEAGGVR
jgi:transposase